MTLVAKRRDQLDTSRITLLSPSSCLRWRNCVGSGEVISWHQVRLLMSLVGTSEAWTFIVITGRGHAGRFVQCCGNGTSGVAVEVGAGSSNSLVAPLGSARYPASLITHEAWPYYATSGELHSIGAATEIFYEWMTDGELPAGLELRPRRPGSGIERYIS